MPLELETANRLGASDATMAVETAAYTIVKNSRALGLIHAAFDDARAAGLPPHHAITRSLDTLSKAKRGSV